MWFRGLCQAYNNVRAEIGDATATFEGSHTTCDIPLRFV
jgi:hypothetical protein